MYITIVKGGENTQKHIQKKLLLISAILILSLAISGAASAAHVSTNSSGTNIFGENSAATDISSSNSLNTSNETSNVTGTNLNQSTNPIQVKSPDPQIWRDGIPVSRGGHPAGYQFDTIAHAITDATNGDTIMLEDGATFNEWNINVNKALTFSVFNNGRATINGNDNGRVIRITNNRAVTFIGITFIGGYIPAGNGAGIYNDGNGRLTLTNCIFINNNALYGGAVYSAGPLTMTGCELTGNTANGGMGGAVFAADRNSVLNYNRIIGNSQTQVWKTGMNNIDARYNWWGSNSGPSNSLVAYFGDVHNANYDPWTTLSISANPGTIYNGQKSTVTAQFSYMVPDGTQVTFSLQGIRRGDLPGGVTSITRTTSAGSANTIFTATSTGTQTVRATVDNAVPECTISISAPPVLTVTKQADKTRYNVGEDVTYTIRVSNTGPGTATNIVVTDTLPPGLTYRSGGSYSAGNITWNIPSLTSTGTNFIDLTFTARVNEGTQGWNILNTASAHSAQNTTDVTSNIVSIHVNDVPVAVDDAFSVDEDGTLTGATVTVAGNDATGDAPNNWVLVSGPSNGALTFNSDGSFTYTPNANFNGDDSYTYRITDADENSNTATVTIHVSAVNDAPTVPNYPPVTTPEETQATGQVIGSDVDTGDTLTYTVSRNPDHGTITSFDPNTGEWTYMPGLDYNGPDNFEITVSDGLATAKVTISITVTPVNDDPVVTGDDRTTNEDTPVNGGVTATDADGDSLTYVLGTGLNGPQHGTITSFSSTTGAYTYRPDDNWFGTDKFTMTVNDGTVSVPATVTIHVSAVNDVPVAVDDAFSVDEDGTLTGNVGGNDTSGDAPNNWVLVSGPSNGALTFNSDGSFTYTPTGNYPPGYKVPDSFTYRITDADENSNIATVTITVYGVNDYPVAVDDSKSTIQNSAVDMDVLANDSDSDGDILNVVVVSDPAHGTATINADGTIHYVPTSGYIGPDSFTYTMSDGHGGTDTATVNVNVMQGSADIAVNTAFYDISGSIPISTAKIGDIISARVLVTNNGPNTAYNVVVSDILGPGLNFEDVWFIKWNAADLGWLGNNPSFNSVTKKWTISSLPAGQTALLDIMVQVMSAGTLQHSAQLDSSSSFDGNSANNHSTASIKVNYVPVAIGDSASVDEDGSVDIPVLANDSDADGDTLTVHVASGPAHGTATINADGTVHYVPTANYNGSDSFSYYLTDGNGGTSATVTVSITVIPVNDAPTVPNYDLTTPEDTSVSGTIVGSDVDGDSLTYELNTLPINGVLTVNADGSWTYTPNANWHGTDSFTVVVSDGIASAAISTVTITVNSVNDAPVANDDSATTNEDNSLSGDVSTNDNPSGDGGNIWSKVTDPANGTVIVNADGSYTYTPNANYHGTDSFDYMITDTDGDTSTATVTITVNSVNDAPVANNDSATTKEDTSVNIDVKANDSDVESDPLTVTGVSDPAHGSVVINADGTVTYTPDANYYGTDSFTYTVSDGNGGTTTGTVNITVERAIASVYVLTTVSKTNPTVGETVTVTFKLGNKGPDSADDVVFIYKIPEGMEFVSLETQPGYPAAVYDPATRTITWTLGTVPVLDPWFKVNVKVLKAGSFNINPTVTTSTYDPTLDTSVQSATVNAVNVANAASSTVGMQETGVPFIGLILALLAVFGGLVIPKRKQ